IPNIELAAPVLACSPLSTSSACLLLEVGLAITLFEKLEQKQIENRMKENKRKAQSEKDPDEKALLLLAIEEDGKKLKKNLEKQKAIPASNLKFEPGKYVSDLIKGMKEAIEKGGKDGSGSSGGNGSGSGSGRKEDKNQNQPSQQQLIIFGEEIKNKLGETTEQFEQHLES
ncbi:8842_t:CDS:2, partial [Ambispora gerdemannii]